MGNTATTLSQGAQQAWANMITFVPNFLAFLVILLLGYLLARLLGKGIDKTLHRLGFDRVLERGGIPRALEPSGYQVSDLLGKLVFYTTLLFALQLAFGVFGPNPMSALLTRTIAFLPNIFVALVLLVLAASLATAVKEIVQASLGGLSYGKVLANGAGIAILVVGVFAALNQLEIAPAIVNGLFYTLLAILAGSAIVAVGGGGIVPMRRQWEKALSRMEQEAPRLQQHLQGTTEPAAHWPQELERDLAHTPRDQAVEDDNAVFYTPRS